MARSSDFLENGHSPNLFRGHGPLRPIRGRHPRGVRGHPANHRPAHFLSLTGVKQSRLSWKEMGGSRPGDALSGAVLDPTPSPSLSLLMKLAAGLTPAERSA